MPQSKKNPSHESKVRADGKRVRSLLRSAGWRLSIWYDGRRPYWVLKNGPLTLSRTSNGVYTCSAETSPTDGLCFRHKDPHHAVEKCLKSALCLVSREWKSLSGAAVRVLGEASIRI